ncbi:Uncharacterized protein SCG7086_AS_00040 [Chlamydiales bacterium SCGC AG-110-P3]|nr:Uncharacterized protein SCG7086_AS_00040 [Chlamydiales bacterium SCGC AG-110-P3]
MLTRTVQHSALIGFAGDVMIGRLVNSSLEERSPTSLWGDMLPILHATDSNIGNLEAALTTSTSEISKVFNFKSDPKNVATLLDGHFQTVNIANNHILDYDINGLLETLDTLDKAGIAHIGAGRNIDEACQPVRFTINDVTFGVLGFTDNEPGWIASNQRPGTRYIRIGDLDAISRAVSSLAAETDHVIASIHWGPNMRIRPSDTFIRFAHALIDRGVSLIHGHSAHLFQGIESYDTGIILYDTGDFVDDYYVDPSLRNDQSLFFAVEFTKDNIERVTMVPTLISNFSVNHAIGEEKKEILARLCLLSAERGTSLEVSEQGHAIWNRPAIE